ncbi:hypothetical protein GP2143_01170 [marine gamma proteobacterium HTCC2143]|uniref:Uncharacterized protein n=1 Tax=marine gamma proteobacterium HTCC2143 TaxID=247633 RepID=A0YGH2_9GAMM|nr:hypothetical protein GP2143_01170 [marine gamma proteobacterium HTCC2143]
MYILMISAKPLSAFYKILLFFNKIAIYCIGQEITKKTLLEENSPLNA